MSTAHVLLVMLQSDEPAGRFLADRGVREGDLLTALKVVDDEPASAVEVSVERAFKIAAQQQAQRVSAEHLLLSVVRDQRTCAHRCLEKLGLGPGRLRSDLERVLFGRPSGAPAARSAPSKRTAPPPVRKANRPARAPTPPKGRRPIEVPNLPAIRVDTEEEPKPKPTVKKKPTNKRKARREEPEADGRPDAEPADRSSTQPWQLAPERFPILTSVGRNLTALAHGGKIDPVFAREAELEQLQDVLARRRANNPVLVGPPGVGKTAVVEGLALRLARAEGDAPTGRILVEVSAGSLVSGTGVRGALAERMRKLRKEVLRAEGRVLLFIDEIHAIVGGDGPDDLASELKAALARGELPCIGATTDDEYRRCFERDAALARRFSMVRVEEPTTAEAVRILEGLAPRYAAHHGVDYDDDAIEAAVSLSVQYDTGRQLPDKAISILDQASARVRRRGGSTVDREAVARVVSELAAVPVERLMDRDADRLLTLESRLASRVVGHEGAIVRIADVLRQGAAGFRGRRPLGTFLLLGPTGVGKTELAKAVAEAAFPTGAMTRIDMSELSEAHSVARLLGAPPGYVGHEDGGQLTEAVRRRPYQLLLLDEIEKAHPDVLLSLLPLLDEGRLTDARGRTVDFTNTIIFMTSNLGAHAGSSKGRIGFGSDDAPADDCGGAALGRARAALPPELWNRIDEPLYFAPLTREDVREIARRMLGTLAAHLAAERGLDLAADDTALDVLVDAGYDPALGARPMRRALGRLVEAPLAKAILEGRFARGDRVLALGEAEAIRFDAAAQSAAE